VAVFAVCVGLATYATVVESAIDDSDRDLSRPTLRRVHDAASVAGLLDPSKLATARAVGPDDYRLNVTLTTGGGRWSAGPIPAGDADVARRRVSVRLAPGRAIPGTLRVGVWR
jgi:hypothetical protein